MGQDLIKGTLGVFVKIKVFRQKERTGFDEHFLKV